MRYRAVNLLIGTACDMKCPYCLQTGEDIPANKAADIGRFISCFKTFLGDSTIDRLIIWGGEPMVYWERLKSLLLGLYNAGIIPQDRTLVTTNARRMTDDYVQFANEQRLWTTISAHDWNFSQEQYDRFFRLKDFSISSIIHAKHINLFDLRERFYDLLARYGRAPRLYAHYVRANDGCSPEYYLSKSDVDVFVNHLLNEVLPMAIKCDAWARWQLAQLLSERRKELAKGNESKCILHDRLAIDLHGNRYKCHHNYDASNIVGNIFSKTIPIYAETQRPNPFKFSDSDECRNCSIFTECHGGCYLSNTHDVDCYLAKQLHLAYREIEIHPWARFTSSPIPGFTRN